jgi:osmotically-inducible protein OsmY
LIEKALRRHWSINADDIHVDINGNEVILTGRVTSIYQKEEAAKIAWKIPGVWSVNNKLEVDYNYQLVS